MAALAASSGGADLPSLLFVRLTHPDAVAYRHEVFRDLEDPALRTALATFAAAIATVRAHQVHAAAIAHPPERHRWLLEAADTYVTAVTALADALDRAAPTSRALAAFAEELRAYTADPAFTTLAADTTRTLADLAAVTYRLRIGEHRVVVGRHDDQPDYGAEVIATFARFRRSETPTPVPVDVFSTVDMNRVERAILEKVVRLYPAPFKALERAVRDHAAFVDPAIATFADELRFYLAWLDLTDPLRDAGLPFCYPVVGPDETTGLEARALFDLALAIQRRSPVVDAPPDLVTNDVTLAADEHLLVITGPNQGGKTTLARAIGQLHHLAAIGVPVPAAAARVRLGEAVHTLFARAEDPDDLTGRLEAELTRARAILDALRPGSVVILNESFESTTVDDALAINRALLGEIAGRGALAVLVTFLGELASFDDTTVSMTSVMDPADPTRPTHRFERRPADDLAHARAVADAHGLGYDAVRARLEATGRARLAGTPPAGSDA